jgi:hypothetical protein
MQIGHRDFTDGQRRHGGGADAEAAAALIAGRLRLPGRGGADAGTRCAARRGERSDVERVGGSRSRHVLNGASLQAFHMNDYPTKPPRAEITGAQHAGSGRVGPALARRPPTGPYVPD